MNVQKFAVKGDKFRLLQCLDVLNDLDQIKSAEIDVTINREAPEKSPMFQISFDVLGSTFYMREECGTVIVAIRKDGPASEHIFQAATLDDVHKRLESRGVNIHWFNHEKEQS